MLCPNHPIPLKMKEGFKQGLVECPSPPSPAGPPGLFLAAYVSCALNLYGGGGIDCRLSPVRSAMGPVSLLCVSGAGLAMWLPRPHTPPALGLRQRRVLRGLHRPSAASSGFSRAWLLVLLEALPRDS